MSIRFTPVALVDIREALQTHLLSLPSPIDSFIEDRITESEHYQIRVDDDIAGFTSLHKGRLITQFVLEAPFKRDGQRLYREVKKLEAVQAALVPTYDEFFLSHALDEYRQVNKQAYIFAEGPALLEETPSPAFTLRLAEVADIATIREGSGDFFGDVDAFVRKRELYLTFWQGKCVGFGIQVRSVLCGPVTSIGMYIIEEFRRQGAGAATLILLRQECHRLGLRVVAGCAYTNHLSKKTLERAGMFTQTRLLHIEH